MMIVLNTKNLAARLRSIKPSIEDDFKADGETIPGVDVTLGFTPEDGSWAIQTGDNSFSGNAESFTD